MDLNLVIAELRAELETVNQITAALEKLHEIRKRREAAEEAEMEEDASPRPRGRKPTAPVRAQ